MSLQLEGFFPSELLQLLGLQPVFSVTRSLNLIAIVVHAFLPYTKLHSIDGKVLCPSLLLKLNPCYRPYKLISILFLRLMDMSHHEFLHAAGLHIELEKNSFNPEYNSVKFILIWGFVCI